VLDLGELRIWDKATVHTKWGIKWVCINKRLEEEQLDLALTGTESLFQIRPRQ
jgi:hypothetical protein